MGDTGTDAVLQAILALPGTGRWEIDRIRAIPDVTAYAVRALEGDALRFSLPIVVPRPVLSEIPLDPRGSRGAVSIIIERIKRQAPHDPALGPLTGRGTQFPQRCAAITEPYTLAGSPRELASDLWHAGSRNFADAGGVHLLLCGAIPLPSPVSAADSVRITETIASLCDAVAAIVFSLPGRQLESAWIRVLDQQLLRDRLPELGLVNFIGDGARPARCCTRYRPYFRVAGPKDGVNVPFACPVELGPVELELPASGESVTGLGIRRREVFAVAGSNAQGKTTFLEGIIAGMDDHLPGDGRERIVTVPGLCTAEAVGETLAGADMSMFFSALPPGMNGTVRAAYGMGSGSMTMACQVQSAVAGKAPLLVIDEDRAAANLLVRSCLQTGEITPLSEILARDPGKLGETTLVVAACAMDTLVAQADRIMILDRHVASALDPETFRQRLAATLLRVAEDLR